MMATTLARLFALFWIVTASYGINRTLNEIGNNGTTKDYHLSKTSNLTEKRNELPHILKQNNNITKKDEEAIPQAMTPLRVVATSAVIKDRLSKPRQPPKPVKAIHLWGATPFKTVVNNLLNMNNRIRQQQKRLFLPFQNTPPLQEFGVEENPQTFNPKQAEFLLPENQLDAKAGIEANQLPPLTQENEHFQDTPGFSSMLAKPNYDQVTPEVQTGLEQFQRPQDAIFNPYSQLSNQAITQQLLSRGMQQMQHHHHHHHKGNNLTKFSLQSFLINFENIFLRLYDVWIKIFIFLNMPVSERQLL